MSCRIRCYTLFDITKTGITNRKNFSNDSDVDMLAWQKARNKQCNFDTILQLISLRSQPEDITEPVLNSIKFSEFNNFGFLFEQSTEEEQNCWNFDFTITHQKVFDDGITELGLLYNDCDTVPMIPVDTAWNKLQPFLDTSIELRNIYFEVISNEDE